jgi:peptide/nickel transport system substrate-binding protein
MSIVPKHLLDGLDYQKWYEWDFWLRPVGNGPYRYLRYQPGTMVELEANPDYYRGKPPIERVVLKFTRGASLTELLSGSVDAIVLNDSSQLPAIANDARFRTYWEMTNGGSNDFVALLWQNEHPLFRDPEVRRALSLAINRRELLQVLNQPPEFSLVDGVYTSRQARRGEGSEPRYNVAEAVRLLDTSGWRRRGSDGLRQRAGREFRFTALTQPGSWTTAALYVQDQFRDLGVRMEVQPLERSTAQTRLRARNFEAAIFRNHFVNSTDWQLGFLGVEPSPIGYRSPDLTRLLERLRMAIDPVVEDQLYGEMSDLLRRDQPFAFLFRSAVPHVVHTRVRGLAAPWHSNPLVATEDLWLDVRLRSEHAQQNQAHE